MLPACVIPLALAPVGCSAFVFGSSVRVPWTESPARTGRLESRRTAPPLIRLHVGGKIFGMEEDEPKPDAAEEGAVSEPPRAEESAANEPSVDGGPPSSTAPPQRRSGELPGSGGSGKSKKKKKKTVIPRAEDPDDVRAEKLAQEVHRKLPNIGVVEVDDKGNFVGGVDPFEGMEPFVGEKDQVHEDEPNEDGEVEWPEVVGYLFGMDDPPDAPWRLAAEQVIRERVSECGLRCYDILWSFHKVEVTVTRADVDEEDEEAGYVDSNELLKVIRGVNAGLNEREDELNVLKRHELIIATPGAKDILTTDKEFKAFKGFDVAVKTGGPFKNKRTLEGKLVKRTIDELFISVKGREVRIPLALVDEVRLPKAREETESS